MFHAAQLHEQHRVADDHQRCVGAHDTSLVVVGQTWLVLPGVNVQTETETM